MHKIVLLSFMFYGFIYFVALICYINAQKGTAISVEFVMYTSLAAMVLFVIPVAFSMIMMGIVSLIISGLGLAFPANGKLQRLLLITEEFVRSLKPGGRRTPATFPSHHPFDIY